MPEKPRKIFRSEALEHHRVQEQFDKLVAITTVRSWFFLLLFSLIIAAIIFWACFTTIPTQTLGQGLLLPNSSIIYSASVQHDQGIIKQIHVAEGELIEKGQVVVELEQTEMQIKLNETLKNLDKLQNRLDALKALMKDSIAKRESQVKKQEEISRKIVDIETENLDSVKELLKFKKEYFSKQETSNILQRYYSSLFSLQKNAENLVLSQQRINEYREAWQDRIRELTNLLDEEKLEVNLLKSELEYEQQIRSPISGKVISIQKNVGDSIAQREDLILIASVSKQVEAIAFMPIKHAKLITDQTPAFVSPTIVKKEKFGSIKGKVKRISDFPSTEKRIHAILKNDSLVKAILRQGPVFEVHVELITNANNPSGFEWTSSQGPNLTISAGTWVTVLATIKEEKPITLILPAINRWLGKGLPETLTAPISTTP